MPHQVAPQAWLYIVVSFVTTKLLLASTTPAHPSLSVQRVRCVALWDLTSPSQRSARQWTSFSTGTEPVLCHKLWPAYFNFQSKF